ncbi:MAG: helix-turn-helix domain-containing protein [Rhodospirillales bacterium]|nr:helix-turn-helix domain-containing protein [Rhodospirillales bacterium]
MAKVKARVEADGTVLVSRPGSKLLTLAAPRTDWTRIDATTEAEIERQAAEDDAEAQQDAAAWAKRVRARVGLSQTEFAKRIGVPVATVRNWEQGKRSPHGPARALLRVLDRIPKAVIAALAA